MKLLTTELEAIPWLSHGFFTRMGGVSSGIYNSLNCGLRTDDKPANVHANRARVAEALCLSPQHLLIANQFLWRPGFKSAKLPANLFP